MKSATFDEIVSGFYSAATGDATWNAALERLRAAFNARFAVLQTLDLASGRLLALEAAGPDPAECTFEFIRTYHRIDPRRERALRIGAAAVGRWQHCSDHFDEAFVATHPFYQDFSLAYGVRYGSYVMLPPRESVASALVLEMPKSRGPLDQDERESARRLGEHLRDAVRAHERMRELLARTLAGHALLQGFPYPMWLIDDDRSIVFRNPAAAQEASTGRLVEERGPHLVAKASRADAKLTERLYGLARAGHGSSAIVDIRSHLSDPPLWLHLSLLIPGSIMGAFGERPQILVTLFDSANTSPIDPFVVASLFSLTPAEARVAARLADGLSAKEIAAVHDTQPSTVRSQVRQVLQKLGTQRTVDVVRILNQGHALWPNPR